MGMLEMQTDMQYRYFPGYRPTRELNLNASNRVWPSNNVDKISNNRHYYNGSLAPPYSEQYLPGSSALPYPEQYLPVKEKVKKIMLQHEAVFRDQIHELHRVYNRQRELMDEMKKIKSSGIHLQPESSQSNHIFPGTSFERFQQMCKASTLPWLNPARDQSFISHAENNQSHLRFIEGKLIQAGCNTVKTEHCVEASELESKFKKVGQKILDLELPAYEYIDCEQEESLASETVPAERPSFPAKSIIEDKRKNGTELSHGIDDCTVIVQNGSVTQPSLSTRTICLADLNEPVALEEEMDPESINFPSPVWNQRLIPCRNLPGEDLQIQPKETMTREDPEALSNVLHLEKNDNRWECLSDNDEAEQSSSNLNAVPQRTCTETLYSSSEDDQTEQGHESSTSHLKLGRKRKLLGLESNPGEVAASSKHASNELIPLADSAKSDSSLVLSRRKHTHDFVRLPIAVQALPCFNSPVRLRKSSKFRSHQIIEGESCLDMNVEPKEESQSLSARSSFCNDGDEFSSEDNGIKDCIKDSVDLNSTRDLDLNCASPSCSSVAAACSSWSTESNVKLRVDCNYVPGSGEKLVENELVVGNRIKQKSSGFQFHADIISCMNRSKSSPPRSLSSEIELHAPASPENEELSPPRGDSDENQLETLCTLSEQGNDHVIKESGDLLEDLIRVAAEAIVSISSSEDQNITGNAILKPSEVAESVSLDWFARLASSVVDDPKSDFGLSFSCKNPDRNNDHPSDGIDYFEVMTLKLKEITEEEYCCETDVQEAEAVCATSPSSQPRKGRSRRGRQPRKDFQNEILPSLTSLSRYEVAEDLQVIGGLIEAVHRTTGRNGRTRGRRRSSIPSSKAESSDYTEFLQQSRHGECRIQEWSLLSWGKTTRRRRGQRQPVSNPRLILGQV
ncbi:uncharacterized protein LOC126671344 [Mercurialis annua]|uniref:uncharacterized protein LOC126671344 n=1 Tax=Mercurialis annua TaxID=3986 RepID=UPI002160F544|nr:uncharacterized protein LOC126671344 [Mercurialis annua]XP_050221070.1 uncharacterized protein LOC126671344 [Mercurialis annua]